MKAFRTVGRVALLYGGALRAPFAGPFRRDLIFAQMTEIGIRSLPIVSIASVFIGMVLAFQTAYQIERFGAETYVGGIVAISMARELAPVVTALVVAGRVGAGMTAELGTMRVTEQVDAIESMGLDPIHHLVWPRLVAATLMLPVLTIYADLIGYIGGYIVGIYKLDLHPAQFVYWTRQILIPKDIVIGLIKTFAFGAIIGGIACYAGLHARDGAEGVGRATTVSVVASSMMIFAADYFLTAFLHIAWR